MRSGLAAVLGVLGAAVVTAVAVWTTGTRTSLLMTGVEDTALHRLAIPAIAAELRDSDVAERINTGPLRLTRADIDAILRSRFGPEAVAHKARQVHDALVRYVRAYPADTVFRISLRREKPILARAAERRVLERFRALPDCGTLEDLQTLASAGAKKIFGTSSDREFLAGLPDCRPPEAVAEAVTEGIHREFDRLVGEEGDSVDVFPDPEEADLAAYSARIGRIQTVDRVLGREPWIPLLAAGALLGAVALVGRRSSVLPGGWALAFAVGVGLAAFGGVLVWAEGLPRVFLEAFGAGGGGGGEIRRLWMEVAQYGVERALRTAGILVGTAGLVLALGGAVGVRVGSDIRGA